MNRVVTTQPDCFSVLASVTREALVDLDPDQLTRTRIEIRQRQRVLRGGESLRAAGGRKGCSPLGIGHHTGCDRVATLPELRDDIGAVLLHHQLDQRRGVEVEDQRRCSRTKSETEPEALTRGTWGVRGFV